jgi:GMP synthase-like glutamine amidotransferase
MLRSITWALLIALLALPAGTRPLWAGSPPGEVTASGSAAGTAPAGAMDGRRFALAPASLWKGDKPSCWWQIRFPEPRAVGAILQINGEDEHRLHNAPRNYAWQRSDDGQTWHTIPETVVRREKRLFRIHRLNEPIRTRYLRLQINLAEGDLPALREVEFYPTTDAAIPFPDWVIAVSSLEGPCQLGAGLPFIRLARRCPGWENVPGQWVWHGDFDEAFVAAEPRPLCAFLSGSFLEWCQCEREPWRGVQQVLKNRNLPMWGACGGAQVLAILEETGVDRPWDCPRCRDAKSPRLPIYSHIGHTGPAPCGDYNRNVGERGKYRMRQVARDPVFAGVPEVFEIMESHVGQITYPPKGWVRVATRGPGAHTVNQCLRVKDRYIYSAQFHMEMDGTPENSRTIMSNFLRLAREWGGYNPHGKPVAPPQPLADER